MQDYIIFTDSAAGIPEHIVKDFSIKVIPIELTLDGEHYVKDTEISPKEFYSQIRKGKLPKTTCINQTTYVEYFEPFLKAGKDILYISFSSGLSSLYNVALNTSKILEQKYPDNKLVVVDSRAASMGQGLLVYYAAKEKESGKSLVEVAAWLEGNKNKMNHWFTVDDLFHLKRGGRVSSAAAIVGGMLNIKPVLDINLEGKLVHISKIRGRKAALLELFNKMEELFELDKNEVVYISHADAPDDAQWLAEKINEKFNIKVELSYITPVIGSHTGSGTVALFFFGKNKY